MNIEGYMTWLVPMAQAIAYNPADADDLLQEGALALYKASRTFDPSLGVPFESWGRTHARRAMLDWFDRQPQYEEIPDDLTVEDKHELGKCGLGLALRERNILILRAAGYQVSEIADALDLSPSTVTRIAQRAAEKLQAETA